MMFVLENSIVVSIHTNTIREHLFLVIEKSVSAEIVSIIDALVYVVDRGGGIRRATHIGGRLPEFAVESGTQKFCFEFLGQQGEMIFVYLNGRL